MVDFDLVLKAAKFRSDRRFIEAFSAFRSECSDPDWKHYDLALLEEGIKIEFLFCNEPERKEGKSITVPFVNPA